MSVRILCQERWGRNNRRLTERVKICKMLFASNPKICSGNELHWPAYHRTIVILQALLEVNPPLNEQLAFNEKWGPRKGQTPLTVAAQRSPLDMAGEMHRDALLPKYKQDCVQALLKAGADPNLPDGLGFTPLALAVNPEDIEIARLLLEGGADPSFRPPHGKFGSALDIAEREGKTAFLEMVAGFGGRKFQSRF